MGWVLGTSGPDARGHHRFSRLEEDLVRRSVAVDDPTRGFDGLRQRLDEDVRASFQVSEKLSKQTISRASETANTTPNPRGGERLRCIVKFVT